jgi:hypothetical protein
MNWKHAGLAGLLVAVAPAAAHAAGGGGGVPQPLLAQAQARLSGAVVPKAQLAAPGAQPAPVHLQHKRAGAAPQGGQG